MRIRNITVSLASVALTGSVGVTALSINGQALADVVALPSAASVQVFGRGNKAMAVQFTAVHEFATDALLEAFALTHFGTLTASGALTIVIGSTTYTASSAAVTGVSFGEPLGLLLPVTYAITCSPITAPAS